MNKICADGDRMKLLLSMRPQNIQSNGLISIYLREQKPVTLVVHTNNASKLCNYRNYVFIIIFILLPVAQLNLFFSPGAFRTYYFHSMIVIEIELMN